MPDRMRHDMVEPRARGHRDDQGTAGGMLPAPVGVAIFRDALRQAYYLAIGARLIIE